MKITVQQLRNIIKEEVSKVLKEGEENKFVMMDGDDGTIWAGPTPDNMKRYRGPEDFSHLLPDTVLRWEEALGGSHDDEPSDLGGYGRRGERGLSGGDPYGRAYRGTYGGRGRY